MALKASENAMKTPTGPSFPIYEFVYTLAEAISSPTPKRATIPQKLLRILRCISDENMTLPTFLEELFKSDNPDVAQWTGVFHDNKGAGRVIRVWDSKLQGGKWEADFVNSAVDVVINRTLKHLESNEVRKDWRLPHKQVTEQKVTEFFIDNFRFLHRYAEGAKYLTRFLKGLLREDVSDQELSSKSRKGRMN
ncbi:hypothetical protein EDD11_009071 [Mortierella claussenii]|nr:hypothetical protein EDD11_009071 [Mortierella claussenii]